LVLEGDNTDATKKILIYFENRTDKTISPKEIEKATKLDSKKVQSALKKLLTQNKITRISRGKYRYLPPRVPLSEADYTRYLQALEKTAEIAIHELMLTESLVNEDELAEVEHQIAYFARRMVKARWELEHGSGEDFPFDEAAFTRAKKIHQWSQYMFELAKKKKK
jgi:hypothetical protein